MTKIFILYLVVFLYPFKISPEEKEFEDRECNFNDSNTGTIFFSLQNISLNSDMFTKLQGLSSHECKEYCINVDEYNGSLATCGSYTYEDITNTCVIIYESTKSKGNDALEYKENINFFEKSCINGLPTECKHETINLITNKVLVGYAENMTIAGSVEFCFEQCLKNNIYCKSFLYFPKEKECLLNSASALSNPEAFHDENNEDVLYGHNDCIDRLKKNTLMTLSEEDDYKSIEDEDSNRIKSLVTETPITLLTTQTDNVESIENIQSTYKAEEIKDYDGKLGFKDRMNNDNSENSNVLSLKISPDNLNIKKLNSYPIKQTKKDNYFSEWEMWQECVTVGERLIRKRKCINLKKCRGPLTQMKICKAENIKNYIPPKEFADEVPGPIGPLRTIIPVSRYGSRELINGVGSPPSIYPNALPVGQRAILPDGAPAHPNLIWSPWSENCQKFATTQPCTNGVEVGFVSRECVARDPKDCNGPFFRYCTLSC
uniref:PAN-1 domain and Apple-like domain-containing protein n=1 Tax=Parastrongyloides trichosuri TaxID=131310 RepID=A0A0N4Z312_PARTI